MSAITSWVASWFTSARSTEVALSRAMIAVEEAEASAQEEEKIDIAEPHLEVSIEKPLPSQKGPVLAPHQVYWLVGFSETQRHQAIEAIMRATPGPQTVSLLLGSQPPTLSCPVNMFILEGFSMEYAVLSSLAVDDLKDMNIVNAKASDVAAYQWAILQNINLAHPPPSVVTLLKAQRSLPLSIILTSDTWSWSSIPKAILQLVDRIAIANDCQTFPSWVATALPCKLWRQYLHDALPNDLIVWDPRKPCSHQKLPLEQALFE